jgi:glycosyltransferase involved in cell wall biosynthesis
MSSFVAYDVTRLLMRCAVPSPNGIDRIDLAYARHFIEKSNPSSAGVLMLQALQPALLDRKTLIALLSEIEASWRAGQDETLDNYASVKDRLLGADTIPRERAGSSAGPSALARRLAPLHLLHPRGLRRAIFGRMPAGAVFMHTTHYHSESLFRWLGHRRDVKSVFFIHDLLPLQFPEYFAPTHIAQHRRALEIFARRGRAMIVNTNAVEREMSRFLHARGRRDISVLVRPIPPDPIFAASRGADADLAGVPYFVVCGTIEPRKNHLLLLHVWRELSRQWGERTPKLVVIGRRGWENENVVDLLDRSHELRRHVIEIGGMPTAGVARLMAGARALLMPSFAEGYGLPSVEARAAGAPVIAADIPVFREVAPEATFRPPLDGVGWLEAIKSHADRPAAPRPIGDHGTMNDYFTEIEAFIRSL